MVQDRSKSQTNFTTYDEILRKSLHTGTIFALRNNLIMDEDKLRCWQSSFLSQFDPNEQFIVKQFVFLWREDDYENQHAPLAGFPSSTEEIQWLFVNDRLDASSFSPVLTDEEMNVILSRSLVSEPNVKHSQVELSKNQNAEQESQNCSICGGSCVNKCTEHRRIMNKVIHQITGGLYKSTTQAFTDAPMIRRTLLTFINSMRRYLLPNLVPEFDYGGFRNFNDVMNTIRRCYGIDEERRTMAGLFRLIQKIANNKMNTECKMYCMKDIVRKIAIKKEKDFIAAIDRPDQVPEAMKPERYGPLVNTLLTYIIMRENVPAAKWEAIQSSFEAKIQNGWSYRSWHENRPELYRIIDGYTQSVSRVENPDEEETQPPSKSAKNDFSNQNQPADPDRKGYLASVDHSPQAKQDDFYSDQPPKMQTHMNPSEQYVECINCSVHSSPMTPLTIYHPKYAGNEGFGACCMYDRDGLKREPADGSKWNPHFDLAPLPMNGWGALLAEKRMRPKMPQATTHTKMMKMPQVSGGVVKPEIQVNFGTRASGNSTPAVGVLDSATPFSMVHESCLHNCSYRLKDHVPEDLVATSLGQKRLWPRMITMKVEIDGVGECKLENVLVNKSKVSKKSELQLVIGQRDLHALGARIDFGKGIMEFPNASGQVSAIPLDNKSSFASDYNKIGQLRFRPYGKTSTNARGKLSKSKLQIYRQNLSKTQFSKT